MKINLSVYRSTEGGKSHLSLFVRSRLRPGAGFAGFLAWHPSYSSNDKNSKFQAEIETKSHFIKGTRMSSIRSIWSPRSNGLRLYSALRK
jgi:hypothetical protein